GRGHYQQGLVDNGLGQGDGSSAWRIFFLGMMGFFQANLVIGLAVHDLGQKPVKFEEDIYADTVVGGVKETASFGQSQSFDFRFSFQPACSSGKDRNLIV